MKGKVEDKILRDLFRQKLENAEVVPSSEAGIKIMRQVGRREFLRFNPSRFNIWYAGAIAVAGVALALILATGPHRKILPGNLKNNNIGLSSQKPEELQSSGKDIETETRNPVKGSYNTASKTVRTKISPATEDMKPLNSGTDFVPAGEIIHVNGKDIFKGTNPASDNLVGQNPATGNIALASATSGCAPLKVSFINKFLSCDSCRWTFGDGGSSTEKNPQWLFDIPGEYNVTLSVFGSGSHHYSSVLTIVVHATPRARFEYTPENAFLPADEISFHNYSSDAIKFSWDFGDGSSSELFEPSHYYKKSGRYNLKLSVTTEFGCSDSVIIQNAFSGSGNFINFPNAFIPNLNGPSTGYYSSKSDESAQVFHPVSSTVSEYQLRIFSRRGILIFESNDINIGWDGYYKGRLCEPAVYIWKARGNYLNGEPFTKMGDVTLLKI